MGKNQNPSYAWDEEDFEPHTKVHKKKEKNKPKKQGIQEEFDLTAWENKQKANKRRKNKHKDKDKYDHEYDGWN